MFIILTKPLRWTILVGSPTGEPTGDSKENQPMKKLIALVLAALLALSLCAAGAEGLTLTAPSGAPALAVATLATQNPEAFTFISAETIPAAFAANEADFIIAPINAGAKLYKAGKSTYKLAAVVTWGNLYFASQKADFKPEDMNGADITLFGENTINASIALYTLKQNGIEPKSVSYLAGAANTQSLLLTDENAIVLTAEPALTRTTGSPPTPSTTCIKRPPALTATPRRACS